MNEFSLSSAVIYGGSSRKNQIYQCETGIRRAGLGGNDTAYDWLQVWKSSLPHQVDWTIWSWAMSSTFDRLPFWWASPSSSLSILFSFCCIHWGPRRSWSHGENSDASWMSSGKSRSSSWTWGLNRKSWRFFLTFDRIDKPLWRGWRRKNTFRLISAFLFQCHLAWRGTTYCYTLHAQPHPNLHWHSESSCERMVAHVLLFENMLCPRRSIAFDKTSKSSKKKRNSIW